MEQLIYVNGDYVKKEDAKISVFDRGYLYGDGVFEGIRSYNGRVFKLDEHIKRLYASAKVTMLNIPLSFVEMKEAIIETLRRNGLTQDAYIRVVVSRGVSDLGLDPATCKSSTVVIIASGMKLYPQALYDNGLDAVTVATRRNGPENVNPRLKSLNYLNNILARIEANLAGAAEGIILNEQGFVAECTGENIFIIRDNELITPPEYAGILKGITRDVVMEIGAALDLTVKEELFTRYDLYNADECFLTGTAAEIVPLVKADSREINDGKPGELTKKITAEFRKIAGSSGSVIEISKAN